MPTKISIIIPCFNHGNFICDAIESINIELNKEFFEVIIVNDGSDDDETLRVLDEINPAYFKIFHQTNKGLANARNVGISMSSGKYILPLDADNKIIPNVVLRASEIMDENSEIDIVYTNAHLLQDNITSDLIVGEFEGIRLLQSNYIDACALIRKSIFEEIGLYDEKMPHMGHEDWELWIRAFLNKKQFHYLNDFSFYYRKTKGSMSDNFGQNIPLVNRSYIYSKHSSIIAMLIQNINNLNYTFYMAIQNVNQVGISSRLKILFKLIFRKKIVVIPNLENSFSRNQF